MEAVGPAVSPREVQALGQGQEYGGCAAVPQFLSRLDRARQSFLFGNRCTNSQPRPAILGMLEGRREPASVRYTESSPWPVRRRYSSQYPRGSLETIRHSMVQKRCTPIVNTGAPGPLLTRLPQPKAPRQAADAATLMPPLPGLSSTVRTPQAL